MVGYDLKASLGPLLMDSPADILKKNRRDIYGAKLVSLEGLSMMNVMSSS